MKDALLAVDEAVSLDQDEARALARRIKARASRKSFPPLLRRAEVAIAGRRYRVELWRGVLYLWTRVDEGAA